MTVSNGFVGIIRDPDALPTLEPDGIPARIALDRQGRIITSSASEVAIAGNEEPEDDMPNPTNNVPVTAFNAYYHPTQNTWYRVACIDINNEFPPSPPTNLYALVTYSACGGFDELTNAYSTFAQRAPGDAMQNPGEGFLLPLDTLARGLLWNPDNGAEGAWQRAQADSAGNAAVVAGTPPRADDGRAATTAGAAGSNLRRGLLRSGLCRVLALEFAGNMATDQWMMFFDQNTATPADSSTPIPGMVFFIPADGGFQLQLGREHWGEEGRPLANGLAWAISSTPATLTLGAEFAGSLSASLATV